MEPARSLSGMSPELYEAVMIGNIGIIRQYEDQLDRQFTPTKNTLLHVLAQFTDCGEHVKEIIDFNDNIETLQTVLLWVNTKGETALHIAARNGRIKIVNALLQRSKDISKKDVESGGDDDTIIKQMLGMKNKMGNTALHEAIKFDHKDVAELLFKEDPEYVYPSNNMAEPLYLAAEKGNCHLVHLILNTSKSTTPSYDGPNNRTALHAAILRDCEGCTEALLESLPLLSKKMDAFGWTALHLAARGNLVSRVRQLLKADRSLAYLTAGLDNHKTALHVATASGMVEAMEEILRHTPDCWEINTSDDRNLLHIAVDCEQVKATNFILGRPWAWNLANETDVNGDTPLHLYAVLNGGLVPNIVNYAADVNVYNKENFTPIDLLQKSDVFSYHEDTIAKQFKKRGAMPSLRSMATKDNNEYTMKKNRRQESKKITQFDFRKLTETYMIVSTLIATVTFAAGFTLPGGYDGNISQHQGMAVLSRKASFQAFVVSNTIAVISSILAVFLFLVALTSLVQSTAYKFGLAGAFLLRVSVIAMLFAFTTGSYAVLDTSSGLQITVCILGGIGILAFNVLIMKCPRSFVSRILGSIVKFMESSLVAAQTG